VKDREHRSILDKIEVSKKELRKAQGPSKKSENERLIQCEKKIRGYEEQSKELIKEIKQLKKLQNEHGNELVGLDISEQYPEKIKQLMEEIRFARDQSEHHKQKIQSEELQAKKI